MNWKLRLLKKAVMERIPFKDNLRLAKRKKYGYPPNTSNINLTIKNYDELSEQANHIGLKFKDSTILEIGSGWFPTIPILLSLDGARKVYMSDLNPHMDEITFNETVRESLHK